MAKTCGYVWTEWSAVHPVERAKMIAHELHKNMRDAYNSEMARKNAKGKGGGEDPMNRILAAFGSKIVKE